MYPYMQPNCRRRTQMVAPSLPIRREKPGMNPVARRAAARSSSTTSSILGSGERYCNLWHCGITFIHVCPELEVSLPLSKDQDPEPPKHSAFSRKFGMSSHVWCRMKTKWLYKVFLTRLPRMDPRWPLSRSMLPGTSWCPEFLGLRLTTCNSPNAVPSFRGLNMLKHPFLNISGIFDRTWWKFWVPLHGGHATPSSLTDDADIVGHANA